MAYLSSLSEATDETHSDRGFEYDASRFESVGFMTLKRFVQQVCSGDAAKAAKAAITKPAILQIARENNVDLKPLADPAQPPPLPAQRSEETVGTEAKVEARAAEKAVASKAHNEAVWAVSTAEEASRNNAKEEAAVGAAAAAKAAEPAEARKADASVAQKVSAARLDRAATRAAATAEKGAAPPPAEAVPPVTEPAPAAAPAPPAEPSPVLAAEPAPAAVPPSAAATAQSLVCKAAAPPPSASAELTDPSAAAALAATSAPAVVPKRDGRQYWLETFGVEPPKAGETWQDIVPEVREEAFSFAADSAERRRGKKSGRSKSSRNKGGSHRSGKGGRTSARSGEVDGRTPPPGVGLADLADALEAQAQEATAASALAAVHPAAPSASLATQPAAARAEAPTGAPPQPNAIDGGGQAAAASYPPAHAPPGYFYSPLQYAPHAMHHFAAHVQPDEAYQQAALWQQQYLTSLAPAAYQQQQQLAQMAQMAQMAQQWQQFQLWQQQQQQGSPP